MHPQQKSRPVVAGCQAKCQKQTNGGSGCLRVVSPLEHFVHRLEQIGRPVLLHASLKRSAAVNELCAVIGVWSLAFGAKKR